MELQSKMKPGYASVASDGLQECETGSWNYTRSLVPNLHQGTEIAVLIPCYNEELTVGKVIDDFRRELPEASIYVFDNCSTDSTTKIAREHGAIVFKESRKGKGFVVDSMFARV